jgi:hypothetical protein
VRGARCLAEWFLSSATESSKMFLKTLSSTPEPSRIADQSQSESQLIRSGIARKLSFQSEVQCQVSAFRRSERLYKMGSIALQIGKARGGRRTARPQPIWAHIALGFNSNAALLNFREQPPVKSTVRGRTLAVWAAAGWRSAWRSGFFTLSIERLAPEPHSNGLGKRGSPALGLTRSANASFDAPR